MSTSPKQDARILGFGPGESLANSLTLEEWIALDGAVLARHRTGSVVRVPAAESPFGFAVVRKRHFYPTARDRRRGWFRNTALAPSRVRVEAENLVTLARHSVNPDLALMVGESRRWGELHDSFLLTRWIDAEPLSARIADAASWAADLGRFVARLHGCGFVDRDLHLRNVLLSDDGMLSKIDCPCGSFPVAPLRRRGQRRELRELELELSQCAGQHAADRLREAYESADSGAGSKRSAVSR